MEIAPLMVIESSKSLSIKQTCKALKKFQDLLQIDVQESGSVIFKAFDDPDCTSNRNAIDDASSKFSLLYNEINALKELKKRAKKDTSILLSSPDIYSSMVLQEYQQDGSSKSPAKKKIRKT